MNICAELAPRIVAFLDGELTDAEAATVASHLEACDACRAQRRAIVATRRLLGEIPAPAPDPDAWKRIRREIRPTPRVARAWNAPIPMWAAGSVAAGFLGLAVLINGFGGGSGRVVDPDERSATPVERDSQAALDARRGVPAAPGVLGGHSAKAGVGDVASPGGPSGAVRSGTGRPAGGITPFPHVPLPAPPEDEGPPVGAGDAATTTPPLPPVDPTEEGDGVGVGVGAGVEVAPGSHPPRSQPAALPQAPSTPAVVQWESVQLSPVDAPRLPELPSFMIAARAFDPAIGLPVPRGERLVALHELENGDLLVDRGGDGKPEHYFKISRRRASREGVTFPLQIQRGEAGPKQQLRVTVRKDGEQWLFENRTARRGKWLGRTVLLLDGDHNGRYDDNGRDVLIFGERAEVVPVSDVVLSKDGLTEFGVDPLGGRFAVRPYAGTTGRLKLEASYQGSGSATSVVVRSGDHFFEIARGSGTAMTVPTGTYTVATGSVVSKHARMRILTGASVSVEVAASAEDAEPAVVALGGRCAMAYGLDGDPEQGWVSVALTSISVTGEAGEIYEPVGQGLRMVRFAVRDGEGRLVREQNAAPTRCPKNGHERFGVKLPNNMARDDISVFLFAPAYEQTFGSVAGTFPEQRR